MSAGWSYLAHSWHWSALAHGWLAANATSRAHNGTSLTIFLEFSGCTFRGADSSSSGKIKVGPYPATMELFGFECVVKRRRISRSSQEFHFLWGVEGKVCLMGSGGEGMSKFNISIAVIVCATALSVAYAAPAEKAEKGGAAPHASGGGGGGHPSGVGSGGGHAGGGGSGAHAGGAARGGGGDAHVSARPAISHSTARSSSGGNGARSTARSTGNRSAATPNTSNSSAGSRAATNSSRNAARNTARTATFNTKLNSGVKSSAVRNTLNSRSVAGALSTPGALRNPTTRARITASAATAGWHEGRDGGNGWWRHSNGGYGWVGPLYWPFAYNDMYEYAMWGNGYDDSFWGYGYDDIYAGLFSPYGYDDLTGYQPQYSSASTTGSAPVSPAAAPPAAPIDQLAQLCGQDSHDIAGLPIDQFQQAIQPTDAQRAALDDLANASLKAAQDIKTACPTDIALTAPSRLAAMQQRIDAMIVAIGTVQPALDKFYGLLNDEQKARLAALANDQHQTQTTEKSTGSLAQKCSVAQPGVTQWPTADIDQTVRPTEAQRASLVALQNATTKAADMLKASCLTDNPLTPPARLAAVGTRLDAMLQAVKTVRSALNDFYGSLSDEQKLRFEAIGPQRMSELESLDVTHTTVRKRGVDSVGQIIRRLRSIAF
jgi:hypothetical protein